jgi:hypothetical protein
MAAVIAVRRGDIGYRGRHYVRWAASRKRIRTMTGPARPIADAVLGHGECPLS